MVLNEPPGPADIMRKFLFDKPSNHKGLEKFKRHLFRNSALMKAEVRPHDNNRAARIVNALSQKVLPKAALLPFDYVCKGFERPALNLRSNRRGSAPSDRIINKRVNRLLEHSFLVSRDHLGRIQLKEPLQAVIAVDNAPVEII